MDWQTVGTVSGSVLLGISGLQALGGMVGRRRRTRRAENQYTKRHQAFDHQLQAVLQWAQASKPIFKAWTGSRSFRIGAVADEAVDCKSFYLVPTDGRPLPRFEPGQYLTFSLEIDPRQKPLVRCYSLSDKPREDYYRVTIKRARPPQNIIDATPGIGSNFFHDRLEVGSKLQVQAPQGAFFLDPTDQQPLVLIAGGIGITPILSMINSLTESPSTRTVYVFLGFGNSQEHPFREPLQEIAAQHKNIQFDISYSRPMPGDQLERDYQHRGRVDIRRLQEVLPSNNFQYYVCGPAGMMETLVPALFEWGVPEEHIHFEAFGPATVKGLSDSKSEAGSNPCSVRFAKSNSDLAWQGSEQSLLEFAESQGVSLDFGCRAGSCGQCLLKVQEGKVTHLKEPGLSLADNECLTCIGVPEGDVVLEA